MQDLNDLHFFTEVAEQNSFAAAARKLGMPRSRLSRRIGLLEDRLGVRLIHRSTRRFAVTEIGREYYRHCVAMMVEAYAAQEAIDRMRSEPQGVVRMSCPSTLIYFQLGEMIARFMEQWPKVDVLLESTNRRVDVIREGFDLAIRVRFPPLEESDLVVRKLADSQQRLVASPSALKELSRPLLPADLAALPSLAWDPAKLEHEWQLDGPDGATSTIRHRPRFVTRTWWRCVWPRCAAPVSVSSRPSLSRMTSRQGGSSTSFRAGRRRLASFTRCFRHGVACCRLYERSWTS
jgi:DNA-binding transcriptional LysR family regulator